MLYMIFLDALFFYKGSRIAIESRFLQRLYLSWWVSDIFSYTTD